MKKSLLITFLFIALIGGMELKAQEYRPMAVDGIAGKFFAGMQYK